MNEFLVKLFIFSTIFIGLCYGVDYLIEKGIKTSSYREISKWSEVIEGGIDADILIVGSSRALVHFDPRIIENNTGFTCYNLGLDGSKYESQKKVLNLYLEHNKEPKIVIWSLDLGSFQSIEGVYRYEQFLPFWDEKMVKSILKLNKNQDQDYLNIPIAKYSNNPYLKYRGLLKKVGVNFSEPNLYKGYRESNFRWDNNFEKFSQENAEGISEIVSEPLFGDFQDLCLILKARDIDIHWVVAPYYQEALKLIVNSDEIIQKYRDVSNRIDVEFQDYTSNPLSYETGNFYNGSHLNSRGVKKFMEVYFNHSFKICVF
ncbi:hypothetical protein GCM10009119_38570 [Algoriphagus jejuensis]|uniref:GDSL-like lipase/acylhydrolase family protein n=1 Tax=Algoriphagus jejuensis TaxID=419934 RepID=A0ABP3YL87_9BACT